MALHQNTSVDSDDLILGNWKLLVATVGTTIASGESAWTNLGAGMINSFNHNFTKLTVQAGNAVDPLEGIATETCTIAGELIEYVGENVVSAWGGIITSGTSTTTLNVITAGGKTTLTPKAILLKNRRIVSGVSQETNILVYKATMTNGPQFTFKSDNDEDPIAMYAFEIEGELDTTRTEGDQLYKIEKWLD